MFFSEFDSNFYMSIFKNIVDIIKVILPSKCLENNDTYVISYSVLNILEHLLKIPFRCDNFKSYPEVIEYGIDNEPQLVVNVW